MATASQVSAVVETLRALVQAIKDLGEVPDGHLYSSVMGILTLAEYNACINKLIELGMVKRSNNLLTYVGPK